MEKVSSGLKEMITGKSAGKDGVFEIKFVNRVTLRSNISEPIQSIYFKISRVNEKDFFLNFTKFQIKIMKFNDLKARVKSVKKRLFRLSPAKPQTVRFLWNKA